MPDEPILEMTEGYECLDDDCVGFMEFPPIENCACHIHPPCNACIDNCLTCDECGMTVSELLVMLQQPGETK